MAITFPDAVSSYAVSVTEDPGTNDLSHTVTTDTTLLLCFTARTAQQDETAVTWNGVSMTEIAKIDPTSTNGGDAGGSVWGLINPTPATANFEVTSGTSSWANYHIKAGLNVHGTNTDSVAAAAIERSNDENTVATSTAVHASAGTAGNKLLFFGSGIGDDMVPASNDASFTELGEIQSGGSTGGSTDGAMYIAEGDAPSAITVTWGASDENSSSLIELIAGSSVSITDVNTTESWNDGDTGIVITGSGFVS